MKDTFLNKTPFWGESCGWVSDVLFGLMSLLSEAGLPMDFLIFCLSFSLPVGGHFSQEVSLLGEVFPLGF